MRKVSIAVAVAVLTLVAGSAMAGTAKPNSDMEGGKAYTHKTCEGKGVEWIGIMYDDQKGSDAMDAVSVICKSAKQGEFEVPNEDHGPRERTRIKCNVDERIWGIAYKDRGGKDEADGVTLVCKDKRTGETRIAFNDDLQGGREYVRIEGKGGIGIAYNDSMKGDTVDGVTLVVK